MGLPAKINYEMPAVDRYRNRAGWTPDPRRAVLLVHDLQQYFIRAFADDCPALVTAVGNTAALLATGRTAGMPVVYTAQPGAQSREDRGVMWEIWGPGITADPWDTDILAAVAPVVGDRVQVKHRYSAFVRSDLAAWMADLGRDQLIVTGIYGHIGVLATATDALMRDLQAFVVADAIADFGPSEHAAALQVASGCGAVVVSTAESLAILESQATQGVSA